MQQFEKAMVTNSESNYSLLEDAVDSNSKLTTIKADFDINSKLWEFLPVEVLKEILTFLETKDILLLRETNNDILNDLVMPYIEAHPELLKPLIKKYQFTNMPTHHSQVINNMCGKQVWVNNPNNIFGGMLFLIAGVIMDLFIIAPLCGTAIGNIQENGHASTGEIVGLILAATYTCILVSSTSCLLAPKVFPAEQTFSEEKLLEYKHKRYPDSQQRLISLSTPLANVILRMNDKDDSPEDNNRLQGPRSSV